MPKLQRIERAGFTLVEVLVGLAILALLVVLLTTVFGEISKVWRSTHANIERMQNVRAITDMIASELSTALLPLNPTDKASLQLISNPSSIAAEFKNPDAIFWQAPVATNLSMGDVAVVGYFIRWDESDPNQPVPLLCRLAITAPNPNFLIYSQNGGAVPWLTDAILDAEAPADKTNLYEGLIAEGVVAFFVQCRDSNGQPIVENYAGASFAGTDSGFDSRQGYTDSEGNPSAAFSNSIGSSEAICVLPPTIHVSFVMIDNQHMPRLGNAERIALTTLAQSIANQPIPGDASDFVEAALNDPSLRSISPGLHAHHAEVNLLNAR